jgi:Na+-driven multidrug efflux pump
MQFMRVILLGSVFQFLGFGLNSVIRAEGNPRLAMFTMLINAGLNIVLDALFVWGFRWGVTGAAVATIIAQAVGATWTLAHFTSSRSVLKLKRSAMRLRWPIVAAIIAVGLSPFLMQLSSSVINLLVNRALSKHGGDTAISAYGIIGALAMLILMPVFGINQGSQPIIGYNFGAKQLDRVKATLFWATVSATSLTTIGFTATQVFAPQMISCFADSTQLGEVGSRGLRIMLMMLPLVGGQIVVANFFQSIGQAKIALVLSLLRQVILLIPLILILPRIWGLTGVWAAAPISDAAASIATWLVVLRQLRKFRQLSPSTTALAA